MVISKVNSFPFIKKVLHNLKMLICLTVSEIPFATKDKLQSQMFFPQGPIWTLCNRVGIEENQHESLNKVVFMNEKEPLMATFVTPVLNTFTYIPLWKVIQDQLKDLLYHDVEHSGYLNEQGQICSLKKGKVNWSPLQPTRDHTHLPFHTHPLSAYKLFNATYGWPSEGDIHGVVKSKVGKVVSHLVISIEGIYLMLDNIKDIATCKVPLVKNEKHDQRDLRYNLKHCSWLLLPWTEQDWFMY